MQGQGFNSAILHRLQCFLRFLAGEKPRFAQVLALAVSRALVLKLAASPRSNAHAKYGTRRYTSTLRVCFRPRLQNVVSYIADHYAFDLPLGRLASIACMSESKLEGCFKRQFGCSVTQYIQGRRMSQAEHLLIDTDFTMGQIAQMIGYTTSSRFAELFKKSTGLLPIEYRKLARNG